MKELKYIIVPTMRGPRAILFPCDICHCDIYNSDKVINAGFVMMHPIRGPVKVSGQAESFKSTHLKRSIHSSPDDLDIIRRTLAAGLWDYGVDLSYGHPIKRLDFSDVDHA